MPLPADVDDDDLAALVDADDAEAADAPVGIRLGWRLDVEGCVERSPPSNQVYFCNTF